MQRLSLSSLQEKLLAPEELDSRLWTEKHAPRHEGDLAVHKKKVEDVKAWLQNQLSRYSEEPFGGSRVILLTGPTGAGKTAVVRVLVEALGCQLCEWTAPVPTLWDECHHMGAAGVPYRSKVDEFEMFLNQAQKFPMLPVSVRNPRFNRASGSASTSDRYQNSSSNAGHGAWDRPKVLLIDDLPLAHDADRKRRVADALYRAARASRFPAFVILTDSVASQGSRGDLAHVMYEQALERAGAAKISFNPVTSNMIGRVLARVAAAEECQVLPDELSAIAECSSGDIRNAILTLQFHYGAGAKRSSFSSWDPRSSRRWLEKRPSVGKKRRRVGGKSAVVAAEDARGTQPSRATAVYGGCDGVLSLFHALGKLLHNKRNFDSALDGDESFVEAFRRHELSMDAPEEILRRSHADSATVGAFLHENMLQFMDEEAIDDVAAVLGYLSDADRLLQGRRFSTTGDDATSQYTEPEPSGIAAAASASVAARGILFANAHPVPKRWQAVRAPVSRQVERSRAAKLATMLHSAWAEESDVLGCFSGQSVYLTELQPFRESMNRMRGATRLHHAPHLQSQPPAPIDSRVGDKEGDDGDLFVDGEELFAMDADGEKQGDVRERDEALSSQQQGLQDLRWHRRRDGMLLESRQSWKLDSCQMELDENEEDEIEDVSD